MTKTIKDTGTFSGSIANTSTETITVNTSKADEILILLDDTTEGGAPASYDIAVGVETSLAGFQEYDSTAGSTANVQNYTAYGSQMSFDVTNASGADADYRITVLVYENFTR